MDDPKQKARERREEAMKREAARQQRPITYIDDDNCEVTVTPNGHAFYNMADWY